MATNVKTGKGLQWPLMLKDDYGIVLGVHFPRDRKISKEQMAILKAALWDAAEQMDNLPKSARHNAEVRGAVCCVTHAKEQLACDLKPFESNTMIKLPEPCYMAISYDGKTPYSIPFEQDCELLDLEVNRLGGTASKLKLYNEDQLKQVIRHALEEAAQTLISKAINARDDGRFIHEDATLHCASIVSKLKEQL